MTEKKPSEVMIDTLTAISQGKTVEISNDIPLDVQQKGINLAAAVLKLSSEKAYQAFKLETEANNPNITVNPSDNVIETVRNSGFHEKDAVKSIVSSIEFRADSIIEFYQDRNASRSEFDQTAASNRNEFDQTAADNRASQQQAAASNRSEFDQAAASNRSEFDQTAAANRAAQEAQARVDQQTINSEEKKAKSEVDKFNRHVDEHQNGTQHRTPNGISYTVDENGNVAVPVPTYATQQARSLLPKTYKVEQNSNGKTIYKCGSVAAQFPDALNLQAPIDLQYAINQYAVQQDIYARKENGEKVTAKELEWAASVNKRIEDYSLVAQNGTLVQTNPKGFQTIATEVKDMDALDKQIAKDKKAAAKENPALKMLAQNSR